MGMMHVHLVIENFSLEGEEIMYYNILLVKQDSKNTIMKFDLSKEKIDKKITEFKSGEIFNVDGYQLKANQITRIKIVESELTAEQVLDKLNESIPVGVIMCYSSKSIFEDNKFVKDVTDDFLN